MNEFHTGDQVIYRREKFSTSPGPRARNIDPAPHGEMYAYEVDKFWTVKEVDKDNLVLVTRRGKTRRVSLNDPRLRRANWWERFIYSARFPELHAAGL